VHAYVLYVVLIFVATLLPVPARADSGLALVITNASYPSEIGTLANPHKDGAVIANGLQAAGSGGARGRRQILASLVAKDL